MKPQIRRILRALLFAILAALPLLAEHAGLRRMWTEEVDERSDLRIETQANLIEARLASQFESWLHRTKELTADRDLERAVAELDTLSIDRVDAARALVKSRLVDIARFTSPGSEAWLLRADGTVFETTAESAAAGEAPGLVNDPLAFGNRMALRGRVKVRGSSFVEFVSPVSTAPNPGGKLADHIVVRIPCESVDAWLAEAARSLPSDSWVVVLDPRGKCLLDTRGKLVGKSVVAPSLTDLTEWDQTRRFGVETGTILRSLASAPALLGVIADAKIVDSSVKFRRVAESKLDILVVCPAGTEQADVAFADQIAGVLATIVALTTFMLVYARSRGTDTWIQPSVGLPAMAGLAFLLACSSATLYLTNTLDERRQDQTRAFGGLVGRSLVNELEAAIDMRSAYFSDLDDRLVNSASLREDFQGVARLASEAFPDGFMAVSIGDGGPDPEVLTSRGGDAIDFIPQAKLAADVTHLDRPRVYMATGDSGKMRVVFDAPFRHVKGESVRLLWCIDLSKFLGQIFSPERTSGFNVSMTPNVMPNVALFPAGVSVPSDAIGTTTFNFPRPDGEPHRLALTPRMDLFGAETSRMVVLIFGMFISVAGSVVVTLAVGSIASYRRASRIDPLTGVRNRMDFDETLARELERARRHDRALSLVVLDLDYFKRINDQFKHAAGDDVLRTFVMDLTAMLRKSDTVFRYGGEEFAVLLPETSSVSAHMVIDRVREAFAKAPMAGLERLGIVTFSAGVATWDGEESADAFIDRADAAMYEAKNGGRNRVVTARPKRAPRLTPREREAV